MDGTAFAPLLCGTHPHHNYWKEAFRSIRDHTLAAGDAVVITKEGTDRGQRAVVLDATWRNDRTVKLRVLTGPAAGEIKSYFAEELRVAGAPSHPVDIVTAVMCLNVLPSVAYRRRSDAPPQRACCAPFVPAGDDDDPPLPWPKCCATLQDSVLRSFTADAEKCLLNCFKTMHDKVVRSNLLLACLAGGKWNAAACVCAQRAVPLAPRTDARSVTLSGVSRLPRCLRPCRLGC